MSFFKDLFNDFTANTLNKSIYSYLDQYFDDLNKLNYNYSSIEIKEINQINKSFSSLIKLILLNEKPVNCVGELSSSEKELLLVHLISLYETFLFKQAETTNISFLKLVFEQIQELKNISQQFSFNKINQDSLNYILFVSKIIQYKVNLIEDNLSSKSIEMKDYYLSKLYIILSSLDLSEKESFDLLNKFFSRYYEKSFLFFNSKQTSIKLIDSFKFFFNDLIVENKLDKVIYFNHVLNQLRLLNEDYYKVILPENDFYLSIKKELLNEEEMLVILPYIKDKTILQLIENSNYSHLLTSLKDNFSEKETFFRKIKQLKLQNNSTKTDKEILFCDYDVLFELGVLTNTSIKDYVFQNFCLNSQLIPLSDYIELDSVEELLFVLENNQLSSFIKVPYSVRENAVEYLKKHTKTHDGEYKLTCNNDLIKKLAYFLMLNKNIGFNFFHKYEFYCNPFSILMLKSLGIKKLSQLIEMQIDVKIRSLTNEEPLKHSYYFKDFLDFDLNNPKISALERKIILKDDRNAFISADKGSNQYDFYQNLIKEIQSLSLDEVKNKEKINKLVNLIKFNCCYDKNFRYGIYHEKVLLSLEDFLNLKEDNIWFSSFSIEKKLINIQLEANKLKENLNLNLNFSQYYILPQLVFIDFDLGKYGNETFKENLLNLFTGKTLNLSQEQKLILILNHLDQLKSLDLFNPQSLNLTEEDLIFINKLSVLKWSVFQYENVISFINYLKNIENYTTNENSEFNFNKKEKEILKNLMTQHSVVFKMFNI